MLSIRGCAGFAAGVDQLVKLGEQLQTWAVQRALSFDAEIPIGCDCDEQIE